MKWEVKKLDFFGEWVYDIPDKKVEAFVLFKTYKDKKFRNIQQERKGFYVC